VQHCARLAFVAGRACRGGTGGRGGAAGPPRPRRRGGAPKGKRGAFARCKGVCGCGAASACLPACLPAPGGDSRREKGTRTGAAAAAHARPHVQHTVVSAGEARTHRHSRAAPRGEAARPPAPSVVSHCADVCRRPRRATPRASGAAAACTPAPGPARAGPPPPRRCRPARRAGRACVRDQRPRAPGPAAGGGLSIPRASTSLLRPQASSTPARLAQRRAPWSTRRCAVHPE
jgi:hypothetical protein